MNQKINHQSRTKVPTYINITTVIRGPLHINSLHIIIIISNYLNYKNFSSEGFIKHSSESFAFAGDEIFFPLAQT